MRKVWRDMKYHTHHFETYGYVTVAPPVAYFWDNAIDRLVP